MGNDCLNKSPESDLSIVIPTKNRVDDLTRCLSSLLNQLDENDELIVIDNGSTDGTKEYLANLKSACRNLVVLEVPVPNLPHLFNVGWKRARSSLVGFLNDDTEPSDTWVADIKHWFSELSDASCLGGPTYDQNQRLMGQLLTGSGLPSKVYDKLVLGGALRSAGILTDYGGYSVGIETPDKPKRVTGLTITNMAVRRETLIRTNGFDERFQYGNYDGYFFITLGRLGLKMFLIPGASVKHFPNPHGSTRSAYHLSVDSAKFYSMLTPSTTKNRIRLLIVKFSYMLAWFIAYRRDTNIVREALRGYRDGLKYMRESKKADDSV